MRAYWKGSVSFGLVNIPVKLYRARKEHRISLRLLCPLHKKPLNAKLYCPEGHEVSRSEAIRGFEYEKGNFVIITEEDLQSLPIDTSKSIKIVQFADWAELDPIYFKDFFFIVPEKGAEKAYFLLKEAMKERGKVAIGKVTIRGKEELAAIVPKGEGLMLVTLYYPDEVHKIEFPVSLELPSSEELELAKQLVDALTKPLKLEEFRDRAHEAFVRLVEAKLKGEEIKVEKPEEEAKNLMEALKASIEVVKK